MIIHLSEIIIKDPNLIQTFGKISKSVQESRSGVIDFNELFTGGFIKKRTTKIFTGGFTEKRSL